MDDGRLRGAVVHDGQGKGGNSMSEPYRGIVVNGLICNHCGELGTVRDGEIRRAVLRWTKAHYEWVHADIPVGAAVATCTEYNAATRALYEIGRALYPTPGPTADAKKVRR